MIDLHIHLARLPNKKQLTQLLLDKNYDFIAIACEPWEWEEVTLLRNRFSTERKPFKTAYGIHPMIAPEIAVGANPNFEETFAELRRFLESDPLAQVGEAGLDRRYAGYEPGGAQELVFRRQAEVALELGRDLQIHCVGDYGRIIKVLREAGFGAGDGAGLKCAHPDSSVKRPRPVFHRFGGDAGIVKAGLSLGAFFSIHADTLRKKATREALALIPREHLLFETDADETFCKTHALKDSATSKDVAEMLATTLEKTMSEI